MVANIVNGEAGSSVRSKLNQIKDIAEAAEVAGTAASAVAAHVAASDPHTQYLKESDAASTYQPLDSDLTAVAALTTTTYGRNKLTLVDADAEKAALSGDMLNLQTGTTYTVQTSNAGKVIECDNASAITVTVPNNLPVGFNCIIAQVGAGQVTVSAGASATQRAYGGSKTAGQWAEIALRVRANVGGSAAEYVVSGGVA